MANSTRCACTDKYFDKLLQPVILLLLAHENLYEHVLIQKIFKNPVLDSQKPDRTDVYSMLKKLEEKGMISSQWNDSTQRYPKKKVYSISPAGHVFLLTWISECW